MDFSTKIPFRESIHFTHRFYGSSKEARKLILRNLPSKYHRVYYMITPEGEYAWFYRSIFKDDPETILSLMFFCIGLMCAIIGLIV